MLNLENKFNIQRLIDALTPLAERDFTSTTGNYHVVCEFCGCCCDSCQIERCLKDTHRDDCPTAIARKVLEEIPLPAFSTGDKVVIVDKDSAWCGKKGVVRKIIEGNGAVKVDLEDGLSICFFSSEVKYRE